MREFKQRQKVKKRIYSKFTIALLVLILLGIAHGTWGIFQKARLSKQKLALSEEHYTELQGRHGEINEQIEYLHTASGLEEEVRTKYNLAKDGEQVIVLVEPEADLEASVIESSKGSFWARMTGWFR